jgi:hypothetical protein
MFCFLIFLTPQESAEGFAGVKMKKKQQIEINVSISFSKNKYANKTIQGKRRLPEQKRYCLFFLYNIILFTP